MLHTSRAKGFVVGMLILGMGCKPAQALTFNWLGNTDLFQSGAAWDLGAAPGSLDDAVFNSANIYEVLWDDSTGNPTNNTFTLGNGTATFRKDGGATDTYTITGNADIGNSGTLSLGAVGLPLNMSVGGNLTVGTGGVVNVVEGSLSSYRGYLGDTGTGSITVDGVGSSWTNSNFLVVGDAGTGVLIVSNGGTASTNYSIVGDSFGSDGTVTVDGADSTWYSNLLNVGQGGTGTLAVINGGFLNSWSSCVGCLDGSSGMVSVDGAGSRWLMFSGSLSIGDAGTGELTVSNGGTVSNNDGYVGVSTGGDGTVTVDGAGSSWTNSGSLTVGDAGTGALTVRNGGTVSNSTGYVGVSSGSDGTVTVAGTGSRWTNTDSLIVGGSGNGSVTVNAGGSIDVANTLSLSPTTGTLTVNGGTVTTTNLDADGTLTIDGGSVVTTNFDAEGTLNFRDGGLIVDGGTYSDGNVNLVIDGAGNGDNPRLGLSRGASATVSGDVIIGNANTGSLTINSGSTLDNAGVAFIGRNPGSNGSVTVVAAGSRWINSGTLEVGSGGTGTMIIGSGGSVSNTSGRVGVLGNGTVTIDGMGSSWTNSGTLEVGSGGTGTMIINFGGSVSSTSGRVGAHGNGTVTVDGMGSSWTNSSDLILGALFNTGSPTDTSSLTLRNGGTVNVGGDILNGDGTSTINIDGGSLAVGGGSIDVDSFGVGYSLGSVGDYTLSGGQSLFAIDEYIGYEGIGTFLQTGGMNTVAQDLILGYSPNSTGSYYLNDGDLMATSQVVGFGGSGEFIQEAGTNTLTEALVVGVTGTGVYGLQGGTNSIANDLYLGLEAGGSGSYYVFGGTLDVGGNIVNSEGDGTLIFGGGILNVAGGSIDVDNFRVGNFSSFTLSAGQTLTVGSESIGAGSDLPGDFMQTGGTHTVSGNLIIAEDDLGQGEGGYNLAGGTLDVAGSLEVMNQGTFSITGGDLSAGTIDITASGSSFIFTGGTLSVDTLIGDLVNSGGTLTPGASLGTSNISGDYTQLSDATLLMELGGLAAGSEYDVFNVSGTATLGGTLDVDWWGTFTASSNDTFDILTADTIVGEFDLLTLAALDNNLKWDIVYFRDAIGLDYVRLSVSQVPIPSSVLLFGSGLFGLVGIARRRKAA